MSEILEWVVPEHEWYWMRYRLTNQSKPKLMLVQQVQRLGSTFVMPHQDYNGYSQTICESWDAKFIPATAPPDTTAFDLTPKTHS